MKKNGQDLWIVLMLELHVHVECELSSHNLPVYCICNYDISKNFMDYIVVLDKYVLKCCIFVHTAHEKLMTTYYPLHKLRKIKGLENAQYIDPYAGSKGNSIRYLSVASRTNEMTVA